MEDLKEFIEDLSTDMVATNRGWDQGSISYGNAHRAFSQIAEEIGLQSEIVAGLTAGGSAGNLTALASALDELEVAAINVVLGLESSDTGEARTAAMASWSEHLDGLVDEVDTAIAALRGPTTTISTTPSATSTTSPPGTTEEAPTPVDLASSNTDDSEPDRGGWVLLVLAAVGGAFWLGRRSNQNG